MCYYTFVRYDCGCAPNEPVLVPINDSCPKHCDIEYTARLDTIRHLKYKCSNCQHAAKPGVPGPDWRQQAAQHGVLFRDMPQYDAHRRAVGLANSNRRAAEDRARKAAADPEKYVRTEDGGWRKLHDYEKGGEDGKAARSIIDERRRDRQNRANASLAAQDPHDWVKGNDGMYRKKTVAEKRAEDREREVQRRIRKEEEEDERRARRARAQHHGWY